MSYNLNIKNVPRIAFTQASASITGSFVSIGTLLAPSILDFTNGSTVVVEVSLDGTNIHDAVAAGQGKSYVGTQHVAGKNRVWIPKGTQVYVRGTAGTGTFYATSASTV